MLLPDAALTVVACWPRHWHTVIWSSNLIGLPFRLCTPQSPVSSNFGHYAEFTTLGFIKWVISSVQVMTDEGMFQNIGMDYWLGKAQEALTRL